MVSLPGQHAIERYADDLHVGAWPSSRLSAATLSTWIPLGALSVLVLYAYAPYPGDYFVGGDTWAHIWTSRDVGEVLTQPIMAGSTFPETVARFYRPVSSLSYTLQYALWGLNPLAFHLGDLAIHLMAMLALVALMVSLGIRAWAGALGAAVVALHPLMASVVPAAPRRHDSLVTIGLCVALALVVRYELARRGSKRALALSCVGLALAELSKEIGYVGLALVAPTMLAACFGARRSLVSVWPRIALVLSSWTLLSVVTFVWHAHVVGGLGGYGPLESFRDVEMRVDQLVLILLWPFRANLETYLKAWLIEGGLVLVVAALPLLFVHRRAAATLALGWAWLILSGGFQLITQSTAPWQTYLTVLAFGLMIAGIVDGAWGVWLDRSGALRGRISAGVLAVSVAGVAVFGGAVVGDSVLLTPYPQWHAAGSVAERYLAAIRPCIEAAPPGESVVLADWPVNVDDRTDQFRLVVAGVFAQYSVGPAVYLTMNHPGLVVQGDKSDVAVGPTNRGIRATCGDQGGDWVVAAVYDPPLGR